jgi:hypothetical protein
MLYIGNAFSLSMLTKPAATLWCRKIETEEVKDLLNTYKWSSCVGHQDLAQVLSNMLGIQIPANRDSITLDQWDRLIVAQYIGPRLPEGTKELPREAKIVFYVVEVVHYPPQSV